MTSTGGTLLIAGALAPYLWFAGRDNMAHFKLRMVSPLEHALHLLLLGTLTIACSGVFARDVDRVLLGLLLFVPPALGDELVFHRGIPLEEHDLHAKEHLLLLVFFVVGALVASAERGALPFFQG